MLWIVYNTETVEIYGKFYSKRAAKEFAKYGPSNEWMMYAARRSIDIDKVDIVRLDEWRMWKTLQAKT